MGANAENKTTASFWGIDGAPGTKSYFKRECRSF